MSSFKRLCVYAGSNVGADNRYETATMELARALVRRGVGIVYGGSNVGLMGVLADAALGHGGEVVGVIPKALLEKEIAHRTLTELHVVESMHERKALMAELSDAFVALPGGIGTVEELIEVYTWTQLGLQRKACGLLNVNGYFDHLAAFLSCGCRAFPSPRAPRASRRRRTSCGTARAPRAPRASKSRQMARDTV